MTLNTVDIIMSLDFTDFTCHILSGVYVLRLRVINVIIMISLCSLYPEEKYEQFAKFVIKLNELSKVVV